MEREMKKKSYLLQKELERAIDALTYTSESTKTVYRYQLMQCTTPTDFHELLFVLETGEQQLGVIQKAQICALKKYTCQIHQLNALHNAQKNQWIKKLSTCDFEEEMVAIYDRAVKANEQINHSGWTILLKDKFFLVENL